MARQDVELTHQPVELFKVLKLTGICASGGEAKMLIADGQVTVNGQTDRRKRRKILHGDLIIWADQQVHVTCSQPAATATKVPPDSEIS